MTDEEIARALSTIREAARSEGHSAGTGQSLDTLIALARRRAGRGLEDGERIRRALGVVRVWEAELCVRRGMIVKWWLQ